MPERVLINFYTTPGQVRAIDRATKRADMSRSDWIRGLIEKATKVGTDIAPYARRRKPTEGVDG